MDWKLIDTQENEIMNTTKKTYQATCSTCGSLIIEVVNYNSGFNMSAANTTTSWIAAGEGCSECEP